jgi:hypothetical protein
MYHLASLAAKATLVATASLSSHTSATPAHTGPANTVPAYTVLAYTAQPGGAPSSYLACVRFRESTDGQASSNQFGITPSTWSAYGFPGSPYDAPYSEQVAAFQRIYADVGTSAWSPYDGCLAFALAGREHGGAMAILYTP